MISSGKWSKWKDTECVWKPNPLGMHDSILTSHVAKNPTNADGTNSSVQDGAFSSRSDTEDPYQAWKVCEMRPGNIVVSEELYQLMSGCLFID